jgi:hypothetical protein
MSALQALNADVPDDHVRILPNELTDRLLRMDVLLASESDDETLGMLTRHKNAVEAAEESGDQPTVDAAQAALDRQVEMLVEEEGLEPVVAELRGRFFTNDPDQIK